MPPRQPRDPLKNLRGMLKPETLKKIERPAEAPAPGAVPQAPVVVNKKKNKFIDPRTGKFDAARAAANDPFEDEE